MAVVVGEEMPLENMDLIVVSQLEKQVFNFAWKIDRFPQGFTDKFVSPVFKSGKSKHEWIVYFKKCGGTVAGVTGSVPCIAIGFQLENTTRNFPVNTSYTFYFLDSKMKLRKGPFSHHHLYTKKGEVQEPVLWTTTFFYDPEKGLLSDNGSLNLVFEVTTHLRLHHDQTQTFLKSEELQVEVANYGTVMQQSFKSFLDNGQFSDVILSTKKGSFPASKVILAGQSPVFRAMFLSDMIESKENVVKIEDFSNETVKAFLEFIYTGSGFGSGETESLKENAVELLKISDKYQVLPLKRECEQILMPELNKENAAEFLILANYYHSAQLKSKVLAFVKRFRQEVSQTESFKQLKKRHPDILLELYTEFEKNLHQIANHPFDFIPMDEKFLDFLFDFGMVLFRVSRYSESLDFFKNVYSKRLESLGENHEDPLAAQHNIAHQISGLGRDDDALTLYQKVLEKEEGHPDFGPNHPETIQTKYNISAVLQKQKKYQEALEMFQQVLAQRKKILGENHPETLKTQNAIALVYSKLGALMRGLKNLTFWFSMSEFEEASKTYNANDRSEEENETKGEIQLDTIVTLAWIGANLEREGKFKEALWIYKQVYEIRKAALGENHLYTIRGKSKIEQVERKLQQ